MSSDLYTVVVPVYKSESTLRELYKRIDRTFTDLEIKYELILVEDGGDDSSWQIMQSLHKINPQVKIIRLMRNFGQHNALMCGFSFVSGDYVITIDDDLQNPPEEIAKLIQAIQTSDFDVVFGIPQKRKHSYGRKLGSRIFHRLISYQLKSYTQADLKISNVVIMKRSITDQLLSFATSHPLVAFLALEVTDKVGNVEIEHAKRTPGKSTYSKRKLVHRFTQGILYHSFLPLRGIFLLGIASFCLSFVLTIIYLTLYLAGWITVSGWTTIVLLILFFSAIIMISLGLIGEYLYRITQEIHHTPQFIIRDKEI